MLGPRLSPLGACVDAALKTKDRPVYGDHFAGQARRNLERQINEGRAVVQLLPGYRVMDCLALIFQRCMLIEAQHEPLWGKR